MFSQVICLKKMLKLFSDKAKSTKKTFKAAQLQTDLCLLEICKPIKEIEFTISETSLENLRHPLWCFLSKIIYNSEIYSKYLQFTEVFLFFEGILNSKYSPKLLGNSLNSNKPQTQK